MNARCETEMRDAHEPVMLAELVDALAVDASGCYIDATYGRGGHSRAVLERLGPEGRLIAYDKDEQACDHAHAHFGDDARFEMRRGSFARMDALRERFSGEVAGVFFDLGVSSPQLEQGERGFSFSNDGPLDMRMDAGSGRPVSHWLNSASQKDIQRVLKKYGEEPRAKSIAKRITKSIEDGSPVTSTNQLASLVASVSAFQDAGKSITRVFLALRLYANRELEDLSEALETVVALLRRGGRVVVIAFHSLEDRIVKRWIREHSETPPSPRGLPAPEVDLKLRKIGKLAYPSDTEVAHNPRARSARMRVAERI